LLSGLKLHLLFQIPLIVSGLSKFDIKLVFIFMKCFFFGHMQVVLVFLVQMFNTSVDQCCGFKKTYCFCLWCAHHLLILLSFRSFVSIVQCVGCTSSFLISMFNVSSLVCFVQGVGPYSLPTLLFSFYPRCWSMFVFPYQTIAILFILFLSKLLG
jgi:hypothetical protein